MTKQIKSCFGFTLPQIGQNHHLSDRQISALSLALALLVVAIFVAITASQ